MVDYPLVWAGIYRRSRLAEVDALFFESDLRTSEDRLWTWRLHLRLDTFAVVGLPGVYYRRGVNTSLTQIVDERQLDFVPAHDTVLAELLDHPQRATLLPKLIRSYCALIAFHIKKSGTYGPRLAEELRAMTADALRRMPQTTLNEVLDGMDAERANLLRDLRGRVAKVLVK
jgi:hypothetical protein